MNEKNYFNETSQTYYAILCKHVALFGRGGNLRGISPSKHDSNKLLSFQYMGK